MKNVVVCLYNEKWPSMFEKEADILRRIFGDELVSLHHIGSTAVQGLKAKPVIDILCAARDINRVDKYNFQMWKIGYEAKGENGIAGRRFFKKGGDNRTHHVHIFEDGSYGMERHLAFRDYLRTHSEQREKYGSLKERLARQFPNDIEAYMDGKESFVQEIERQAVKWYKEKRRK